MNDRLPHDGTGPSDDAFLAGLAAVGDQLEAAIASTIAERRNTEAAGRHLLRVTDTEEGPMSDTTSIDPISTPADASDDLAMARRRRTRRWIVAGAAGAVLAVGGVAAATGVFSTDTVERGMPGGSVLFQGTDPSCTTTDDVVFDCTLAHAPTEEVLGDYTGAAEVIVDETSHVNGGCRSIDAEGLRWTCFVGQRAVDEAIISQDFLGELTLGPGRG